MKNALLLIIFLSLLSPCQAAERPPASTVLVDVILMRPGGLVLTIVGSALFVGLTPLTAFAAIAPPHDAFDIVADVLIVGPADFTFNRPIGAMYPTDYRKTPH